MNDLKPVEELEFTDDYMFMTVMKNPEICKGVIQRLLQIEVDHIEYPELQKDIKPYYASHGVRLDVYVKDSDRIFDLEMQTYYDKDIGKRARYYQSMIDADNTARGQDYSNMKESYVIFIFPFDPFKRGKPVYHYKEIDKDDGTDDLNSGAHKFFFNASAYKKENKVEIKNFLEYIYTSKVNDEFTAEIAKAVRETKEDNLFKGNYKVEALSLRDARKRGFTLGEKQGFANGILSSAKKFLCMGLSVEQVSEGTGLSIADVQKLAEECNVR